MAFFLFLAIWFFKFCFVFPIERSAWLSYEVSFITALWIVSSESWKRPRNSKLHIYDVPTPRGCAHGLALFPQNIFQPIMNKSICGVGRIYGESICTFTPLANPSRLSSMILQKSIL
jgi:hypothetical protein